jgi:hypothetical protein
MAFRSYSNSKRGGFAPRRGGRGRWQNPQWQTPPKRIEVKPDLTKHPLGELLTTFSNRDLNQTLAADGDAASIKNCEFVASYNWIDATAPTITVPGMLSISVTSERG